MFKKKKNFKNKNKSNLALWIFWNKSSLNFCDKLFKQFNFLNRVITPKVPLTWDLSHGYKAASSFVESESGSLFLQDPKSFIQSHPSLEKTKQDKN